MINKQRQRGRFDKDSQDSNKIRRFFHTELETEHYGTGIKIMRDGHVILSRIVGEDSATGELEYDEIEVPASLIFKVKDLLNATRQVEYVTVESTGKAELDEKSS